MKYCLMTLGSSLIELTNFLKGSAIRIITLSDYYPDTDTLFNKLNLLKMNDMLAIQELNVYYEFIHNK